MRTFLLALVALALLGGVAIGSFLVGYGLGRDTTTAVLAAKAPAPVTQQLLLGPISDKELVDFNATLGRGWRVRQTVPSRIGNTEFVWWLLER